MLSKDAHIDAIPALEIGANDVKAYHGATVGSIDEERTLLRDQSRHFARRCEAYDRVGLLRARLGAFPRERVARTHPRDVGEKAQMIVRPWPLSPVSDFPILAKANVARQTLGLP